MAHSIDQTKLATGAFYSLRKSAWHSLGQVVDRPADSLEILALAGLDFTADTTSVYMQDPDGSPIIIPGRRAVYRSDTGRPLGVVGDDYTTVQNSRMFEFFQNVCEAGTVIETAGALNGGRRVWALARIPSLNLAIGQDKSRGYTLISNAHDGSQSVLIQPTIIRVVCQNTLNQALSRGRGNTKGRAFAIRHSAGVEAGIRIAEDQYAEAIAQWHGVAEQMKALATVRTTPMSLQVISDAAFEVTSDSLKDEAVRARTIRQNREREIDRIRRSETCNVIGTEDTIYADFQAVTEWIDHAWSKDRSAERAISTTGNEAKARALEAALALV
jgi:phage/plasmid-like protein (TIGR03299 family)